MTHTSTEDGTRSSTTARVQLCRTMLFALRRRLHMVTARLKSQTTRQPPQMVVVYPSESEPKSAGQHRHPQLCNHHKTNHQGMRVEDKCRTLTQTPLQPEATRGKKETPIKTRSSPSTIHSHTSQRTPSVQFANRVNHKIPKPAPRCMANQMIYPNLRASVMP